MMNEEQLEQLCLDWLREGGWDVLYGPDIASDGSNPRRNDDSQIILPSEMEAVFAQVNPHLPTNCVEQLLAQITQPESLDLITNNE
jgi:type I restriction enzyme, R subunit